VTRQVMEVWSTGVQARVYEVEEPWRFAEYTPSHYMVCETCGACSQAYKDHEYVRRLALEHVATIDHSAYPKTEPDDDID
jgi:hypothetical protein